MASPSFLDIDSVKLLLFAGKGGVGKTTCATAAAWWLARSSPRGRFLLVSTDPAHSLADSIAGSQPPGNLEVLELDANQCLERFKAEHTQKLLKIASSGTFLDDEDISQMVGLSLPGLDELAGFFEISRRLKKGCFDCIVVDTAPAGHAVRLLQMPGLIRKWIDTLDALLAKHRYLERLFSGRYRPGELDDFLEELTASVNEVEAVMQNAAHCRLVPVMLPEPLSLSETLLLVDELERLKVPVGEIVINQLYPPGACPVCSQARRRQLREISHLQNIRKLSRFALWGVPLYSAEVRGGDALAGFWAGAARLSLPISASASAPPSAMAKIAAAAGHPLPGLTLLVFAGKGGVGKTTLACATALRLADDYPGKEILLVSVDPAHSLSACLEAKVGPRPTPLSDGLTALEINGQAEFQELKAIYAKELDRILQSLLNNLDLPFDREVMERIFDLSPPGLDEVMALTKVMKLLGRKSYDIFVLDSAPTGHLLRLLELPELVDRWLKVSFGLFLKYKYVFRAPVVSERLVEMSKNLKQFRRLLRDPSRTAVYVVSIPTEMACEETKDLVSACDRMQVNVPQLFLNLVTPPGPCVLCSALNRTEFKVKQRFQQIFPDRRQTVIYRQGDLRGIGTLRDLGRILYQPAGEDVLSYAC